MKVLMFGWEFPPHISGGLGTACFGLTRSLAREEVSVLFVVPKLHGDEPKYTHLINASEVAIPQTIIEKQNRITSKKNSPLEGVKKILRQAQLQFVEVESLLKPYQAPEKKTAAHTIESWSYEFPESFTEEVLHDIESRTIEIKKPYAFSGTYGVNLYDEVERYADVAREIAATHSFDVIHAHDWMTYPAGVTAKRVSGKPLVIHVHATEFDRSGENVNPRVYAVEKSAMHDCDRIVAVSRWTKDILVKRYGVSPAKIEVVHNGVMPKQTEEEEKTTTKEENLLLGSHIITFLGRITYQKGPQYFVEAAYKVLKKFPDAHFVVAGSGDLLPHMVERAASLRIASRFHFTGFLKSEMIDRIWSISNVYVMPSVSEPFGIAPLEAIQSGVPVIVSKQSGVAEVMPHAITVDFWDTDALADAICAVLQYKGLWKTLKRNSEKEIHSITWDKAAKKINSIYHELIEQ